jgi:sugar phosphate isomerase/epimerase
MKLSVGFCWNFPDEVQPEEGLPRLRDLGFEGIELWPDRLTRFGIERWASSLRHSGMHCFQLCPYFDFVHGAESSEQSFAQLGQYLDHALRLDCHRLRVFTGPPWGKGIVGGREATVDQWNSAIISLRRCCEKAERTQTELCLECHEGSLMENGTYALRLIDEVRHPLLTLNLQLPLADEPWPESVRKLGPYTTHIHIHNWTEGLGRGELTYLADGAFNWRSALQALAPYGRSVCLSVEHPDHGGKHCPWETAQRDGPYLQQLKAEFKREV